MPPSSLYRGVSRNRERQTWRAFIKKNRKSTFIGSFSDEISAAKAYDAAAIKMFGKFARLNFPEPGSEYADKTTAICTRCYERKPTEDFPPPATGKNISSWCRSCRADNSSEYYRNHRDEIRRRISERRRTRPLTALDNRRHSSKYRYGLTPEIIDKMILDSAGCQICGRAFGCGMSGPAVDHDHDTGKVRGILCKRCNAAIGALGDSVEGLGLAIEYLRNFRRTE